MPPNAPRWPGATFLGGSPRLGVGSGCRGGDGGGGGAPCLPEYRPRVSGLIPMSVLLSCLGLARRTPAVKASQLELEFTRLMSIYSALSTLLFRAFFCGWQFKTGVIERRPA